MLRTLRFFEPALFDVIVFTLLNEELGLPVSEQPWHDCRAGEARQ
jgi:hypothetical protein